MWKEEEMGWGDGCLGWSGGSVSGTECLPKRNWSPKWLPVCLGIEGLCVAEEVAGDLCSTWKVWLGVRDRTHLRLSEEREAWGGRQ